MTKQDVGILDFIIGLVALILLIDIWDFLYFSNKFLLSLISASNFIFAYIFLRAKK
jgi:hypothetical protein